MKLISLNLGHKTTLEHPEKTEITGIFKQPVPGPVWIGKLGLEGDFIASVKHHGGPDQAVGGYGAADYAWWSRQLGRDLAPGAFGENLTVSELECARFSIGDRLTVGAATLEVTAARIPCNTFARRMGDPDFVQRFREAERPGLYCRVLEEGNVQVGDEVAVESCAAKTVTLVEFYRAFYDKSLPEAALQRLLAAPIAGRARRLWEEQLQKLRPEGDAG